jgi:hypothetical protein
VKRARQPASHALPHTHGASLVGSAVSVYWDDDRAWYVGTVKEFDRVSGWHTVAYDDGEQRSEPLNDPCLLWMAKTAQPALPKRPAPRLPGGSSKKRSSAERQGVANSIESVVIDEFEFRCQSSKAQARYDDASCSASTSGAWSALPAAGDTRDCVAQGSGVFTAAAAAALCNGAVTSAATCSRSADRSSAAHAHAAAQARTSHPSAALRPSARAVSSALSSAASTSAEAATESAADAFLTAVQAALASEPRKHERFMAAMLSFRAGDLDTVEVMEQVASVLAGRNELIASFNTFLPDGYRLEPHELASYSACHAAATQPAATESRRLADGFVSRLVERFHDRPDTLRRVLAVLSATCLDDPSTPSASLLRAPPSVAHALQQLMPLLASAPDLARELREYVPTSCFAHGHVHTIL